MSQKLDFKITPRLTKYPLSLEMITKSNIVPLRDREIWIMYAYEVQKLETRIQELEAKL